MPNFLKLSIGGCSAKFGLDCKNLQVVKTLPHELSKYYVNILLQNFVQLSV